MHAIDTVSRIHEKQPSLALPHPSPQLRIEQLHADRKPRRLDCFDCNGPEIMGYSACWNDGLVTIITHKTGRSVNAEAMEADAISGSWLYAPVDVGETISEVWKKEGSRQPVPLAVSVFARNRRLLIRVVQNEHRSHHYLRAPSDARGDTLGIARPTL